MISRHNSDTISASSGQGESAARLVWFVGRVFILGAGLTIVGLFVYRFIWIASVFGVFGWSVDWEFPEGKNYGPIWISTGDPSLVFFMMICLLTVPFLLWRRELIARAAPGIEMTLKTLILFSLFMIVLQHVVLAFAAVIIPGPQNEFLNSTTIMLWGPPDASGSIRLLDVNDPHYVILLMSLGGLALILILDSKWASRAAKLADVNELTS